MLDIEKIDKDATKLIRSFTKKQLLEFVDWYHQEIALAEQAEGILQPAVIKPRMSTAKLNGSQQSAPKAKGIPIKKMNAKAPQPRSSDGRFASVNKTTRRATAFA